MVGAGPAIQGVDAATGARSERVARRMAELYANDTQVRDARPRKDFASAALRPGMRLSQIVAIVMGGYADRPALGQRAHELVTDPATGRRSVRLRSEFETISYRELWARVGVVASECQHHPEYPLSAGDFVCLLGFTSTDYTTIDLACIYMGAVSVPLQTSAPAEQHRAIMAETKPRIVAVGIDSLDVAVEAVLAGAAPDRLIVFDYDPEGDDQKDRFESACCRLTGAQSPVAVDTLSAVLDRGKALPLTPLHVPDTGDNPLLSLFYTSGSTGTPKGVMYTERMLADAWLSASESLLQSEVPMIGVNYLPMSHFAGHQLLVVTLASGGTNYFAAKSDLSTLFDDIALVRPTVLSLVPRVCELIYGHYQQELDRRRWDGADSGTVEVAVRADMRDNFLGGRVVSAIFGTAPMSAELYAFTESMLDVPLIDLYGSTETGVVLRDRQILRPVVIDYKLVDVPELGYFCTDKPHPRGELLVKARDVTPGYYQRPDVTAEIFDADGFYKTGDIMAHVGPDQLVYVDRRNNVIKLAQGEFVALSHLEAVFATSSLIRQIFLYGNSERSFLLAVVVPTADVVAQLERDGLQRAKSLIGQSLQQIAAEVQLNGYEVPRDFLIESKPFTLENGLLSDAGKLLRPQLKARYSQRLEQMYVEMAAEQVNELRALRAGSPDRPVLETVTKAVELTLGASGADLCPDARFIDLGGDSLSALSFSNLIADLFGVELPVGVVLNPASDLHQLAHYIQAQQGSGAKRLTFAAVHGPHSTEVYASDLTLDEFIDAQTLKIAPTLPRPTGTITTVLLTGATGYLGRFLALDWLQRLAPCGGTLICIARGNDARQARQRIETALNTDSELIERFQTLATDHLEVLAGDIGQLHLGLDEATWNRLAQRVDLIVHAAAHVNHLLPYQQLFAANVAGTAELIRLAITTTLKPVTYISTVAATFVGDDVLDEDADMRVASPVRKLEDTYVNGYANSKWAGEVVLREAHDLCDLPVTMFRCGMILAHGRYAGQLNLPDVFTRLLLSLVTTGIAPRSFYRYPYTAPAHYDGLPVDFVAQALTELPAQATEGFHTYNVVNPHHDGISLDTIVDWLIEAGHPIQRIDDYDQWMSRFEAALQALPEKQRQHSLLTVLDAYRQPAEAIDGSAAPSEKFQTAVHAAHHDIPHLSASLITKYITDLKRYHLL
jgi:fatty acid CoA ligase FadD9